MVGSFVARVTGVPLDPPPIDLVGRRGSLKTLPQVDVLDRLLGRRLPAVPLPAVDPFGNTVAHVSAIGDEYRAAYINKEGKIVWTEPESKKENGEFER